MYNTEKSDLAEQLEKALLNNEYNQRLQQEMENQRKLHAAGLDAIQHTPLDQILSSFREGDTWAAYNLGLMHMHGVKVDKDLNRALQCFELAHERNHSMAKKMIDQVKQQIQQDNEIPSIVPEVKIDKKEKKNES